MSSKTFTLHCIFVLCLVSLSEEKLKKVKIGVILPMTGNHPWTIPQCGPAIEYAIDTIRKTPNFLRNYRIKVSYKDSQCSQVAAPHAAIDFYVEKAAHVFIGPACKYAVAPVARFSFKWRIPVITAGALVSAFKDKGEYKLLTRILGSYAKAGSFVMEILNHWHWKAVGMIFNDIVGDNSNAGKSNCFFTLEPIYKALASMHGKKPWHLNFDESKTTVADYESFLQTASRNARTNQRMRHILSSATVRM
ncbi:atrial natriuretic peptide receptor 3-like [Gigantopelta aegis]|uniref:atrial natriuretic peptide receptor 3-like n=1 Tax=Gigantopelta aegis TaxID=1735272 RepID=UPI001B888377|nr:atrial natriuretic peptide receptor 3-like [Gigantopelta aegis]